MANLKSCLNIGVGSRLNVKFESKDKSLYSKDDFERSSVLKKISNYESSIC